LIFTLSFKIILTELVAPSCCRSIRASNFQNTLNFFFCQLKFFCDLWALLLILLLIINWKRTCLLVPSIFGELELVSSCARDFFKKHPFFSV
jgi:hypothetical protein